MGPRCIVACTGLVLAVTTCPAGAQNPPPPKPQPKSVPATSLQQRQALMRQWTIQQQTLLEQRSRCINQATTLQELDRCELGYPYGRGGMHRGGAMGGWTCPIW